MDILTGNWECLPGWRFSKKLLRRRGKRFMEMKNEHIFPTLLIVLDILAGVVYLCHGDVKKFIYWIAAAVLNITVTF